MAGQAQSMLPSVPSSRTMAKGANPKTEAIRKTQGGRVTKPKPTTSSSERPDQYHGAYKLNEPHIINKYLEVRTVPGKGRGVFTRVADIPAGTLLFQEPALLCDTRIEGTRATPLKEVVRSLSRTDQEKFAALTWHGLEDDKESRMLRNSWYVGDSCRGVWFWISLTNHDCKPNCRFQTAGEAPDIFGNLRTEVDIPLKGTEISVDYVTWDGDERRTVADRAEIINRVWGFKCWCDTCAHPATTDKEAAEITQLQNLLFPASEPDKPVGREDLDKHLGRLVGLLEEYRMLDQAYEYAYYASRFYSDRNHRNDDLAKQAAVKWTLEAIRLGAVVVGIDQIEDEDDASVVVGVDGKTASEPRFLPVKNDEREDYLKLLESLPGLMKRKMYGNLQALEGKADVSDLPGQLY